MGKMTYNLTPDDIADANEVYKDIVLLIRDRTKDDRYAQKIMLCGLVTGFIKDLASQEDWEVILDGMIDSIKFALGLSHE